MALGEQPFLDHAALESEMWPDNHFRTTVNSLCGLFISAYDSKLSFIRQTAREFLTNPRSKPRIYMEGLSGPSGVSLHNVAIVSWLSAALRLQSRGGRLRPRFASFFLITLLITEICTTIHSQSRWPTCPEKRPEISAILVMYVQEFVVLAKPKGTFKIWGIGVI